MQNYKKTWSPTKKQHSFLNYFVFLHFKKNTMKNFDWKSFFKNAWPHVAAILLFFLLTCTYFAPVVFEDKGLPQGDVSQSQGWGKDGNDYVQETGNAMFWSNRMFGGMPHNYTIANKTSNIFHAFENPLSLGLSRLHVGLVFLYLIGFYIFLVAMGCNPWLAILGSFAYAFASYNFIIIEAGHVNKGLVMATIAPIIGGVILCYRGKYLWGVLITLIFVGLNVMWNHQQISYYLMLILACLALVYFIFAIKEHTMKNFIIASVILVCVAGIAAIPAAGKLLPSMDYAKESMRGGAVLQDNAEGEKESSGLERDYAYQWSYGKAETLTLLVPNMYGGSSHYNLGNDSECYRALRGTGQGKQFCRYAPTYWGPQPFTSGPVYAGAIVCFLFILGLFVVKGPEKWWLLAATIISIILSWGGNFPAVNNFLFDHLPLYNKFRTPSMALIIAGFTMAATAALAIKEICQMFKEKKNASKAGKNATDESKKIMQYVYISAGITGGLCLLFALFGGSLFSFSAPADANYPDWLISALKTDRKSMLTTDAWRSLVFIAMAFALVWAYIKYSFKANYMIIALGALILIDLWAVDKRFLNDDSFVKKEKALEHKPTPTDELILQDTDPDYRVLNLTTNTFNEANTSYFHKSIGGYSPAKLRRYQDIIDYHFARGLNMHVLNMLNTRYFIVPGQDQSPMVQRNPNALGNAWFVDSLKWVNGPDEEIVAITNFNPAKTAFIDNCWKENLKDLSDVTSSNDSAASIQLVNYADPGNLIYESNNPNTQLAVFSEVYYKTWHAYIDGQEQPLVRVNYILRGLEVPAGKHTIEFKCIDDVFIQAQKISKAGNIAVGILLVLLIAGLIAKPIIQKRKEKTVQA